MHDHELNQPSLYQTDQNKGDSQPHEVSQDHQGCPDLMEAAARVIMRTQLKWDFEDI